MPLPFKLHVLLIIIVCCCFLTVSAAPVRLPTKRECQVFAEAGSCMTHDQFMHQYCSQACHDQVRRERFQKFEETTPIANSFFELVAEDIDGNIVDFAQFKGKVTVVVNVASECGYTEDHYNEMVGLYNSLLSTGANFELVAFPCNQFDGQEPGDADEIKAFTQQKGVKFTVMKKINVNGRRTHDVYRFLKIVAGPSEIEWNFATYYVIDGKGRVNAFSDVTPLELRETLNELLIEL